MKRIIAILATALALAIADPPRIDAAESVSVEFFHESLAPHGEWLEVSDYGYVWHPRDVGEEWRPYTEGNWAYTDAGWTWVSEEPFGSIVYHYGRWISLEDAGWVWVPDTEWGPAWVSWRRSERHVGWAPLPPEARFQRTVGIKSWSDAYYDVGPTNYTFVEVKRFGAPKLRQAIVPVRENVTIIRETRNITNITVQNNIIYAGGPEYDVIVRESAEPVRRLRLERRTDFVFEPGRVRTEEYRTRIQGDTLSVIAPTVQIRTDVAPSRVARRVEKVQVNRGWRDLGPQGETIRAAFRKEAPQPPAELPPQPKFDRAAVAAERASTAPEQPAAADAAPAARTARDPAAAGRAMPPAGGNPADKSAGTNNTPTPAGEKTATGTENPAKTAERPMPAETGKSGESAATSPEPGAPKETRPDTRPGKGTGERPATARKSAADSAAKPDGTAATTKKPKDAPAAETAEPSTTPSERSKPAASKPASEGSREPGEKPRRGKPEAAESSATAPGTPEKPATDTRASESPRRGRSEAKPERPDRGTQPEATAKPDASAQPDRPARERPEGAAEMPDRGPRPDRRDQPAGAERSRSGDRPGAPASERGDRPGRERPNAAAPARDKAETSSAKSGGAAATTRAAKPEAAPAEGGEGAERKPSKKEKADE